MTVDVTRLKDGNFRVRANPSEFEALKLLVEIGRQNLSASHELSLSPIARGYLRRPPFVGVGGPLAVMEDRTKED